MSINREYLQKLKTETKKRILQERIDTIAQLIFNDVLLYASKASNTTCDIIVSNYVHEMDINFPSVVKELQKLVDDVEITLLTFDYVTKGANLKNVYGEHIEIGEKNKLVIYTNDIIRQVRYILRFDWS